MFCRRCGAQIPEDSTFCARCGTPVAFTSAPGGLPGAGEQFGPFPAGEQFMPLPAGQSPPPPPPAWTYPAGPGPYRPPPPPPPPLWDRLFGPRLQPGAPLNHRSRVQRGLFSRLRPSVASSVWFGAILGPLFAFGVVVLLCIAFSLTLGPLLDQNYLSALSTGNIGAISSPSSSNTISFYSNPLLLLTYAHRSTFDLKISFSLSTNSPVSGISPSESFTPPLTLLLIIPAIGLLFGGYLAASTNYGGRRLFSITRGASIGVIYALLVLIISLVASSTILIGNAANSGVSESLVFSPEAVSALLNGLLWGLVFGALGGYLHSRALPKVAQAGPGSRATARIRGALAGAGLALTLLFALCLIVVVGLYILAQLGGPSLHTQGSPTSSGSTGGNCSIFLQQPDSSAPSATPSDLATHIGYALVSPSLAVWVMPISMGAPFALTASGISVNIGLFASNCGPGEKGAIFYVFLLLPAISIFLGGRLAARVAQVRTAGEAAGAGLLMAVAITLLLLIISFYTAISISVTASVLTTTVTGGPSLSGVLLAGLIFGGVLGVLGSVAGRPRNLPPLQPAVPSGWPAAPPAWPPAPQGPVQPIISSAVASFQPASAEPGLAALENQPTIVNPVAPGASPPAETAGGGADSADTTLPTP